MSLFDVTEVELIYHNKQKAADRPPVRGSEQAYDLFLKSWDMGKIELQEQFKAMFLDRSKKCMGVLTAATGGISECIVDLRLVFAAAIKARASCIIIAHNHPSGETKPGREDSSLTQRFARAGEILNLPVVDHLIVARNGYVSFNDLGLMPTGL